MPARAQDDPGDDPTDDVSEVRTIARVLASAGVNGHFLDPVCDEDDALVPATEGMYSYAIERAATAADHPMVLDAGGLLTPNGVLRFAARNDPSAIAEMVSELGYRALALGESELGAPRDEILGVLRSLRARHVPAIASNLRCRDEALPLCDVVVDASDGISIHRVNELRMAVLAMLAENALDHVAPDLAAGLRVEPVEASVVRDVRRARARGADLVVAVLALSVDATLSLVASLPDDGRPDLVILADEGDTLFSARPTTVQPAIVAPAPGDAAEIVIREELDLRLARTFVAEPLAMRGVSTSDAVLTLADDIGDAYCAAWGRTLPGATLARPIDATGIAELAAELARERTGADVAVLNLDAVDATWIPAREGALTESDVYVALQYDEPLVTADVSREWIEALARHAEHRRLVTPGLGGGEHARVGERALVTRARYRVVTLRFLADGGDDALEGLAHDERPDWRPVPGATLRSIVEEALARRDTRDPRDVRERPGDRPEWLLTGSVDGTFSGSSISNPGYDVSSLNRSSTISLGTEVNLGLAATAPDWSWETTFVGRYRTQWSPSRTAGTAGAFTEAADQIQIRSTGSWRGVQRLTGSHEWYVPDPYIEAFVETELTPPAATVRDFHWFLVRPLVGARFNLTSELDLKIDVGFQTQALAPALQSPVRQSDGTTTRTGPYENSLDGGVGAVLTLRPWDLLRSGDRHTTVSGVVDFFWSDPLTRNWWQLRGQIDAQIDLAGPLSLSLGVRLYMQQDRGEPLGLAVDATAGFRIASLARLVGP
jgi:2',3'-cyclic-nucleotide 2'-phosphodiesterase (5'-nucleotidase family)